MFLTSIFPSLFPSLSLSLSLKEKKKKALNMYRAAQHRELTTQTLEPHVQVTLCHLPAAQPVTLSMLLLIP